MPLETRDSAPYWAARNRMTSEQLDKIRTQARLNANQFEENQTRSIAPAAEAIRRKFLASGQAVKDYQSRVQAESLTQNSVAGFTA